MDLLIKILFFVSLILFPLGEIARFDFFNGFSFLLNDFLMVFTFAIWFIFCKKKNSRLTKPILLFLSVCILSLFLNLKYLNQNELLISFLYIVRWVAYAGMFCIVAGFNNKFKELTVKIMLLVNFVFVVMGFIQYVWYPNLKNLYYLGWDEHNFRMFSSFLDPNFAGTFFVLGFVFTIGILLKYAAERKTNFVIVLSFLSVLNLICIFLTFSRSALLMLIVGASVFLILIGRKKLIMVLLLAVVFLVLVIILNKSHLENTNLLRISSTEARIDSSKNALLIAKENPLFGVGFNAYRYAQIRYGLRDKNLSLQSHADAGTDNSFLFVLSTTGIIGLLAYFYLWFRIFRQFKSNSKKYSIMSIIAISSIISIFVNAQFINSLFFPFILEWIWLIIGLTENN